MAVKFTCSNSSNQPIPPLFNDVFLKVFGSPDSASITGPMLNAIFNAAGLPGLNSVEIKAADASLPGGIACKTPRLDVVVVADDGRIVNLEAQKHKVDIGAKSMLYASRLLADNTPKGIDNLYISVPKVIVVILLEGCTLFPDSEQLVSLCRMTWDIDGKEEPGPDNVTIILAELDKARARYNNANIEEILADESVAWLYLLSTGYRNPEEVRKMAERYTPMEEFAIKYGIALDDPRLKDAYDRYWMANLEYNSIIYTAREDARAEGLAEGREEGIAQGIEEGIAQGIEEGIEQGMERGVARGIDDMVEALRAAGADDVLIEKAAEAARARKHK